MLASFLLLNGIVRGMKDGEMKLDEIVRGMKDGD